LIERHNQGLQRVRRRYLRRGQGNTLVSEDCVLILPPSQEKEGVRVAVSSTKRNDPSFSVYLVATLQMITPEMGEKVLRRFTLRRHSRRPQALLTSC
jgi:hypothetical protein